MTFPESRVLVAGEVAEVVDLPGAYSLDTGSPAELEASSYLTHEPGVPLIFGILRKEPSLIMLGQATVVVAMLAVLLVRGAVIFLV